MTYAKFRCEQCKKTLKAPLSAAGKTAKCPHCGERTKIAIGLPQIDAARAATEHSEPPSKNTQTKQAAVKAAQAAATQTADSPRFQANAQTTQVLPDVEAAAPIFESSNDTETQRKLAQRPGRVDFESSTASDGLRIDGTATDISKPFRPIVPCLVMILGSVISLFIGMIVAVCLQMMIDAVFGSSFLNATVPTFVCGIFGAAGIRNAANFYERRSHKKIPPLLKEGWALLAFAVFGAIALFMGLTTTIVGDEEQTFEVLLLSFSMLFILVSPIVAIVVVVVATKRANRSISSTGAPALPGPQAD
jgi:hypothetical protein